MIRIKKKWVFFWSGSKIFSSFFDPDQKIFPHFLIRIKKSWWIFDSDYKFNFFIIIWPGSKIYQSFFSYPDQKVFRDFLYRTKNLVQVSRFSFFISCGNFNFNLHINFQDFDYKYHQYRKKWTSKTGVNSNFYLIERELWQNFVFFDFGL